MVRGTKLVFISTYTMHPHQQKIILQKRESTAIQERKSKQTSCWIDTVKKWKKIVIQIYNINS